MRRYTLRVKRVNNEGCRMRIVEELNKGWQIQGFEEGTSGFDEVEQVKEGWITAQVPGVVHFDLLREGKIADPFYALQEKNAFLYF